MQQANSIRWQYIQNVESIGSLNTGAESHRTSVCARNSSTFRHFCEEKKEGNSRCSGKKHSKFHVDTGFVCDRARVTTAVLTYTIKWTPYYGARITDEQRKALLPWLMLLYQKFVVRMHSHWFSKYFHRIQRGRPVYLKSSSACS
jgi:hypothetical protein